MYPGMSYYSYLANIKTETELHNKLMQIDLSEYQYNSLSDVTVNGYRILDEFSKL